jgi:hypothetical protein
MEHSGMKKLDNEKGLMSSFTACLQQAGVQDDILEDRILNYVCQFK